MLLSRQIATLATTVAALGLAACGGDDTPANGGSGGGSDKSARDDAAVYTDAVRGLDRLRSGTFSARLDTELAGNQRVDVRERGRFDRGGGLTLPRFSILIGVEQSDGPPQKTAAINTGEDFFVKANGAARFESQGMEAVRALQQTYRREQQALGTGRLPLLSLAPADWAKSPRVSGTATIDGETVRRVVADLDVPTFLKELQAAKEANIGMGVTLNRGARAALEPGAKADKAELVALVGEEDGRLRRLTATADVDVAGGVQVEFDVTFSGLDEPQTIDAPGGA